MKLFSCKKKLKLLIFYMYIFNQGFKVLNFFTHGKNTGCGRSTLVSARNERAIQSLFDM